MNEPQKWIPMIINEDEESVLACRPVVWPWPDMKETPIYPGSIVSKCVLCQCEIFVGPFMQKAIVEITTPHRVCCLMCAAKLSVATGQMIVPVTSLGNPYKGSAE